MKHEKDENQAVFVADNPTFVIPPETVAPVPEITPPPAPFVARQGDMYPGNWSIYSEGDGLVYAENRVSGNKFRGTTADFNRVVRGEIPPSV